MQRHLLEFGRSILLQATKTIPRRSYLEDRNIQGVKILLKMGIGIAPSIGARRDNCHLSYKKSIFLSSMLEKMNRTCIAQTNNTIEVDDELAKILYRYVEGE